jgi:gluconolactonase
VAPDGSAHEHVALDDFLVTNLCFADRTPDGDPDPERRTAYVTCSSTGRLVAVRWPRPGLRPAH